MAPYAAARHLQHSMRFLLLALFLLPWVVWAPSPASAQTRTALWSVPVNISRSGAASQPVVFAAPDGLLQAFWWDRFDGLMTAVRSGEAWSEPLPAQIYVTETVGVKLISRPLEAMPTLVADADGRVHAFWQGPADPDTGLRPLLHSRSPLGTVAWNTPDMVADGTIAMEAAALPDGGLALAYIRQARTASGAPGLYVRRLDNQGAWGRATPIHPSLYLRLLDAGATRLRLTATPDGALHLAWMDAALEQALYARSSDGGATWSAPQPVSVPESIASAQGPVERPRVAPLPDGGALLVYEASLAGACTIYQQRVEPMVAPMPTATPSVTTTASIAPTATISVTQSAEAVNAVASESGANAPAWGAVQRVLDDARACPENDRFWLQGNQLYWVWGEGSGQLTLLAWDAARAQWSEPYALDLRLRQPKTERWLAWDELSVATFRGNATAGADDMLVVLGTDAASGDVWLTRAHLGALEMIYAPPSPWSLPEALAEWEGAGAAAVAVDGAGAAHMVWTLAQAGGTGSTLHYARWDGTRWSRAVEVTRSGGASDLLRHPALLADSEGLLHLAWSGGAAGQIYYSRAKASEATAAGWSAPQELPAPTLAGDWPHIGLDAAGRLYIAYIVPLNEGRGVYLVRSADGGESWSPPEQVFDAAAAGWAMVDHPALAVALDGALHLAWTRAGMPGTSQPQGIYYASSTPAQDAADPHPPPRWSEPLRLAESGFDWPQLAWVRGDLHLIYTREGEGSVWHRWVDASAPSASAQGASAQGASAQDLVAWKPAARVPGWQEMAGPVGLGLAGGTLHLAGVDRGGMLHYSAWERPAAGAPRWSEAETLWLGPEIAAGLGAAAGAAPLGGRLAVALNVQWAAAAAEPPSEDSASASALQTAGSGERLLVAAREIPTVDPATQPTWAPTPRPTTTPEPTLTPTLAPTFTPDLSGPPVSTASSTNTLFLGGGLAALLCLVALVARGIFGRRG